jgi:flagella basal body P-ring formation protein FlgA
MKFSIAAALLVVPVFLSASHAEVRLMDSIAVEAPTIELGEIAYIETEDLELRNSLADVVICEAPRGSNSRIISSYRIKAILEEAGLSESCEVLGGQTTVSLSTRVVDNEELVAAVEKWVDEHTPEGAQAEVDVVRLSRQWNIPTGREVEITVELVGKKIKGNVSFTLYAVAGGEVLGQTRLRAQIKLMSKAFVLVQPLKRSEILTAEHVDYRDIDVTNVRGTSIADIELVMGLASRRDLKVDTILAHDQFEKPVVVKRGTVNRIVVRNGNIEMSIVGAEALQDGRKDDIVLFRNPMNTREPLRAKVIRAGVGLIELR